MGRRGAVLPSDRGLRLGLLPGEVMVRRREVAWRVLHPGVVGQVRPSGLQARAWDRRQDRVQEMLAKCRGGQGLQDFEVLVPVLRERGPDPKRVRARDRVQPVQDQDQVQDQVQDQMQEGSAWRLGWALALQRQMPEQVRDYRVEGEVRDHRVEECRVV